MNLENIGMETHVLHAMKDARFVQAKIALIVNQDEKLMAAVVVSWLPHAHQKNTCQIIRILALIVMLRALIAMGQVTLNAMDVLRVFL